MAARNTTIYIDHIEMDRYLYVRENGACRITTEPTRMQADEICMNLHISLPRALFKKPQLRAKVHVPNDVAPSRINVDVSNQVAEAIRKATGLPVTIEIVHPQPQE